jgi:uncharacterized protein (TIGR04141 family)
MSKKRSHRLAIYLLKESLASPEQAVDAAGATRHELVLGGVAAILFCKQAPPRRPNWSGFFDGTAAQGPTSDLRTASAAAVVLMPSGGRWFALVFGTGHFMLEDGSYVDDFGLRVTVNAIPPDRVRSVDHDSLSGLIVQHRSQGNRAATCGDLGVDVDKELVKALTGNPKDHTLGGRMSGVVALTVTVPSSLDELPALLDRYHERYESKDYLAHFDWIDHLQQVRDPAEVSRLDALVVDKLRNNDLDGLALAAPEVLEHDDVEEFAYRSGTTAERYDDTNVSEFMATVADYADIDIPYLTKRRFVVAHRASGAAPKRWSVYKCLCAEIEDGLDTLILHNGKWYRVKRDFVASINAQVKQYTVSSSLPAYEHGGHESEGAYNVAVATAQGATFDLMDKRLIRVGGTPVEFCDLFGLGRQMVHVKRGTDSSDLSHLFAQGEVPARLLLSSRAFRAEVISRLSAAHKSLIDVDSVNAHDFTVVYAITSRSVKPIDAALPFFSRMTFARVAGQLRLYGFKVQLMKIEIVDLAASQHQAPRAYLPAAAAAVP